MIFSAYPASGGRPDRHGIARAFSFVAALTLSVVTVALVAAPTRDSFALPQSGDHALRILTPTLLELEFITRHGDANAPFAGIVGENYELTLPPASAFEVTVNGARVAAQPLGFKRRVLYAPLNKADVRLGNWLYLKLAQPLPANARVEIGKARPSSFAEASADRLGGAPQELSSPNGGPSGPALPALPLWSENFTFTAKFESQRLSPAIHVNQLGYAPTLPKVAMIGHYLGSAGELALPADARKFQLLDARTHKTVHRGQLTPRPDRGTNFQPPPYRDVWQADFTDFRTPGEYRLAIEGLGVSLPFRIHDGAPMAFARAYALGLYHQRCGHTNELPFSRHTHDACHVAPAEIPLDAQQHPFTWKIIGEVAAEKRGESKPVAHPLTGDPNSQLFPFARRDPLDVSGGHHDAGDYSKYTSNSAAFVHTLIFAVDALDGVAALDNLGVPESGEGISDLLQIAKWEADFLAKLQDEDGGFYFLVYPRDRRYESNALPDAGEPQVVWPKNTAVTAAAVAALAQAASSPHVKKHFPRDAERYLAVAKRGWEFLQRAFNQHGARESYQRLTHYGDNYAHDDEMAWAACELFLATGEDAFQRELFRWMPDPANSATRRWGWQRLSESWGNAIRSYAFAARSGRISRENLDARFLQLCEAELLAAGDDAVKRTQASAYATAFPLETKRYRSGGWYFSLDSAMDAAVAWQLEPRDDYLATLVGNMNYEGGANAVNRTFISGVGNYWQRELVHQYAQNDRRELPPSGIPIGNIQAGLPNHPPSGILLRTLSFPDDASKSEPYGYYDRWSDVHNVSTEFIIVNQARGLVSAAFLAARTDAAKQPWRAAEARIVGAKNEIAFGESMELRLEIATTQFGAVSSREVVADVPAATRINEAVNQRADVGDVRSGKGEQPTRKERSSSSPGTATTTSAHASQVKLDLRDAVIIWEARAHEPHRGQTFAFSPRRGGAQWVEAEAVWPDGRRVFATAEFKTAKSLTPWVDDEWPSGAREHPKKGAWLERGARLPDANQVVADVPAATRSSEANSRRANSDGGGVKSNTDARTARNESSSSSPGTATTTSANANERDAALTPFSGTRAFAPATSGPGLHEHGFDHASDRLEIGSGDVLFVHVWLDPQNPPRGILVAWNDGESWEHRAFWGESPINYGRLGGAGRVPMGKLPEAGRWVRLDIPAREVGLENTRVRGMSFAVLDGRAVWDLAGVRDKDAPTPRAAR